jgi:hypothetical protein
MELSLCYLKKAGFSLYLYQLDSYPHHFTILINGSPFGLFTPACGLRQGDPLSPFLFILGTEVFSRLLQRQFSLGSFKGLKMLRTCSPITHLLFVDDLLIFAKATSYEASTIRNCLYVYRH